MEEKNKNLAIVWNNLSFKTNPMLNKSKSKYILNNLNGFITFGSLNAVMGSSGAGKTVLLKCLSGRFSGNGFSDSYIHKESQITWCQNYQKIRICFIEQDIKSHLWMGLTVEENLLFASKLKNSHTFLKVDHRLNVEKVMKEFMIKSIGKTLLCNCSFGEQKRIAIASELCSIVKPNLLFIDEPTSGLDSNSAEVVIQCLSSIIRNYEIAIVASIHQPNQDLLLMFDQLYVLSKAGMCAYFGPPKLLSQYLRDNAIEIKNFQIPIEVLLKIASKEEDDKQLSQLLKNSNNSNSIIYPTEDLLVSKCNRFRNKNSFSLTQFVYLMHRILLNSYRSKVGSILLQFFVIISLGVILAKLYSNEIGKIDGCISFNNHNLKNKTSSCVKSAKTIREDLLVSQNLKFLFFDGVLLMFLQTAITTLTFPLEIRIFLSERSNGWYSTGSYYWAKTVVELPFVLITSSIYLISGYIISGQIIDYGNYYDNYRFFGCICTLIVGVLCSQGLGFLFGILGASNQQMAIGLSMSVFIFYMIFSGFITPLSEMVEPLQWFSNISYLKQSFQNVIIFIYGMKRCSSDNLSSVLYLFDLSEENEISVTYNAIILTFHLIFVRIFAFLLLIIK